MSEVEKPNCYGYVLENRDRQEEMGKIPVKNCAECEFLEKCTAHYNARVYNDWADEYHCMTEVQVETMIESEREELESNDLPPMDLISADAEPYDDELTPKQYKKLCDDHDKYVYIKDGF